MDGYKNHGEWIELKVGTSPAYVEKSSSSSTVTITATTAQRVGTFDSKSELTNIGYSACLRSSILNMN